MNVFEMHIEVKQATQNIAANTRRKLQSEEIDWILNKNVERFIADRVKPKKDGSGLHEVNQFDIDGVRTLLSTAECTAKVDGTDYKCMLPADYSFLLSDDSRVTLICGTSSFTPTSVTENVLRIPLKQSVKSAAKFYETVSITIDGTTHTLADLNTNNAGTYNGLASKQEIFVVRDAMLSHLRSKNVEVYWERYHDIYYPNHFLFPGRAAGSITIDSGTDSTTSGTVGTITYTKYNLNGDKWSPNRLTASSQISVMIDTAFVKSHYHSPISELEGNYLIVHGDRSFIVSKSRVNYVKKPRKINLALAQNCDLPEEFHPAICDMAVEYFKAMTQDPNWEVKLKDNMMRSQANP
jgi:hypothetical protein